MDLRTASFDATQLVVVWSSTQHLCCAEQELCDPALRDRHHEIALAFQVPCGTHGKAQPDGFNSPLE